MKRRSKRKEELSRLTSPPAPLPVVSTSENPGVNLRNIYGTRLVINGDRTPSGKRYDFAVKEIKTVDAVDVDYLLSLKRKQTSCCGGANAADLDYFEIV